MNAENNYSQRVEDGKIQEKSRDSNGPIYILVHNLGMNLYTQ